LTIVGLPPAQFWYWQLEHFLRLNIRNLPKLLHEFRDVDEAREARVEPVAGTIGSQFHRRNRFAKTSPPTNQSGPP